MVSIYLFGHIICLFNHHLYTHHIVCFLYYRSHLGTDQVSTLDVARVQSRVNEEESVLHGKRVELESLRQDVSSLDTAIASNTAKASEKRQQAKALQIEAAKIRAEESVRKADIIKAVDDANIECRGE